MWCNALTNQGTNRPCVPTRTSTMYEYIGHTDRQLNRYVRLLHTPSQAFILVLNTASPLPAYLVRTNQQAGTLRHMYVCTRYVSVQQASTSATAKATEFHPARTFPIFRRLDIGIHASNKCKLARPRQDDVECARPDASTRAAQTDSYCIHVPGTCVVGMLSSIVPTVCP